ncbi:MAG: CHASE2 domain-containing protein [Phycisphaerales bacterium]|nr:MAG: CHASE2 domain-containing protein [Phycisphaerales bacterium]
MTAKAKAPPDTDADTTDLQRKLNSYKEKLLEIAAIGLPVLLVQVAWKWVADRLVAQPWHVLCFLCPLLVAALVAWKAMRGRQELVLRGRFLIFFVAYILVFSIASSSDLLVWNRNVTVFEHELSRNWLAPGFLGDWRYWIVPKKPLDTRDVVVVTMKEADRRGLNELRMELAKLIQVAADNRALGIAFDFYFAQDSDVDQLIGDVIKQSEIDVIIGFTLQKVNGEIRPLPTAPRIEAILPADRQGHLVGLVEPDHMVRLIPLYFRWQKNRPSLSLRVAQRLAEIDGAELTVPPSGLLRFIKPRGTIPQVSYAELAEDPNKCALMRDSWVLVGGRTSSDTFLTPFGKVPGVLVHAYAIHSLRHGHFLTRPPWWSGLFIILVSCYIISTLAAQRASRGRIIRTALLLSALVIAASIFALVFWLIWLDVIYALVAIWLLVPLLIAFRKSAAAASGK